MKGMYALSEERSEELARRLSSCVEVKAAQDCAANWLDEIGAAFIAQPIEADLRKRAGGLLCVARAALELMGSVDRAQWKMLPGPAPRQGRRNWREWIGYVPSALMAIAAIWSFLCDQTNLCLLSAVAAMGSVLAVREGARSAQVPRVEAAPMADAGQLARRIGYLLREVDAQLGQEPQRKPDTPMLTVPMLESVQMLIEGQLTGDAEFALKGVPQLADALKRQGIDLVAYAPENARDFDLLPAPQGGETIRPAVRQGDMLLLRGQATVKI